MYKSVIRSDKLDLFCCTELLRQGPKPFGFQKASSALEDSSQQVSLQLQSVVHQSIRRHVSRVAKSTSIMSFSKSQWFSCLTNQSRGVENSKLAQPRREGAKRLLNPGRKMIGGRPPVHAQMLRNIYLASTLVSRGNLVVELQM
jgi:hypothetical protein